MGASKDYASMILNLYEQAKKKEAAEVMAEFIRTSTEFTSINWEESDRIAKQFRTRLRECYGNCLKIAAKVPELQYHEGYALSVIPMAHAWLVNEAGEVIDPTWCLVPGDRSAPDYFGASFSIAEVRSNRSPYIDTWYAVTRKRLKGKAKKNDTAEEKSSA